MRYINVRFTYLLTYFVETPDVCALIVFLLLYFFVPPVGPTLILIVTSFE